MIQLIKSRLLYKMLIIYSLLTLIPLTFVSATFYTRSKAILEEKALETGNRTLAETVDKIDGVLRALSLLLPSLEERALVHTLLRNDAFPDKYPLAAEEKAKLRAGIEEMLKSELETVNASMGDYIDDIVILNVHSDAYTAGNYLPVQYPEALRIMPYNQRNAPQWAFFADNERMVNSMKILDKTSSEELGAIAIMVSPDTMAESYSSYLRGTFFVTSSTNIILSADNRAQIGKLFAPSRSQGVTIASQQSGYTDYRYYSMIRTDELTGELRQQAQFAAGLTLFSWLAVVMITYWLLKRITNPLRTLSKLMRTMEKEQYQIVAGIRTTDEIALLCHSFNSLVIKTRNLIEEVYKAELMKKEAELKAIRMQFNPHFLYNTLEYIGIMAKRGAVDHVYEVVKKVADIFRFSISSEQFVALETELVFVRTYLEIHEFRFGGRFRYAIQMGEELGQVEIPKLILQPLIENAFVHGIDGRQHTGWITIRAYEEDYDLAIEVEDHGGDAAASAVPAASPGTAANAAAGREGPQPQPQQPQPQQLRPPAAARREGMGTGLQMVKSQIHFHYGERYGVELIRTDTGTKAKVRLPIKLVNRSSSQSHEKGADAW